MLSDTDRQELRTSVRSAAAAGDARKLLTSVSALRESGRPADVTFCASELRRSRERLISETGALPLKSFFVRSVTVEPMIPYLAVESAVNGVILDLTLGGYGSYMEEMMSPAGALSAGAGYELVILWLDAEEMAGRLPELCAAGLGQGVQEEIDLCVGRVAEMLHSLRARSSARLLLCGCAVPDGSSLGDVGEANLPGSLRYAIQQLNRKLAVLASELPDCIFFDLDHTAARFGRERWRDRRLWLSARLPVAPEAFSVLAADLIRTLRAAVLPPRKVLCTDLDNTFWGGVLGEEGVGGIETGSAFPGNCFFEYQQYLHRLRARGVLLAAVSKNNPADVEEAFQVRAADLALKLTDFAALKISWQDKAEALRELARELSLGLDSFVFVDDNPTECEAIRQHLPQVAVVQALPQEPWTLVPRLQAAGYFDVARVTTEDLVRSDAYEVERQRFALSESAVSPEAFLASLEITCSFLRAADAPMARAVQLLGKTNQFNLTTRRHSAVEVERFASAPGGQAVAVRVRDRFGDTGVVGLLLARTSGDRCVIDTLLLSCRVIGRGIETALLAHAAMQARADGARWLEGEYRPTKKNELCANFYPQHGFAEIAAESASSTAELDEAGETKFYRYDLKAGAPAYPAWLQIEGEKENEYAASSAAGTS